MSEPELIEWIPDDDAITDLLADISALCPPGANVMLFISDDEGNGIAYGNSSDNRAMLERIYAKRDDFLPVTQRAM